MEASVILLNQFLGLIRDSGVSKAEAHAALSAASALVSAMPMSHDGPLLEPAVLRILGQDTGD